MANGSIAVMARFGWKTDIELNAGTPANGADGLVTRCRLTKWAANGELRVARYIVRAKGAAGPIEFQQRLTIEEALAKARELRDAHFSHITIFNVLTGVEITDLEALMGGSSESNASS